MKKNSLQEAQEFTVLKQLLKTNLLVKKEEALRLFFFYILPIVLSLFFPFV